MIALGSFLFVLGLTFVASFVGRHLRRASEQQTRPVTRPHLYIVRDERADITEAQRRG